MTTTRSSASDSDSRNRRPGRTDPFRAFADHSPDDIRRFDRQHRHLFINPAACRRAGKPAESFIGKTIEQTAASPAEARLMAEALETTFAGGEPCEIAVPALDGMAPRRVRLLPEKADDGSVAAVLCMAQDGTKPGTRGQFPGLLDSIDIGCIAIERDWRISYINPRAAGNSGRTPEEVTGRVIWEAFPYLKGSLLEEKYRQAMEANVPVGFAFKGIERPQVYWVRVYPYERGIVVFWVDVTEQERVAAALRRSEKENRELVETGNSIILRWDCRGTITFMNDWGLRFFGYSSEELLGQDIRLFVPPENLPAAGTAEGLARDIAARPELYAAMEAENVRRDGGRVWVSWSSRAIVDAEGKVSEVLAVGHDITALKRTQEELTRHRHDYRTLADHSPDIISRYDLRGRYTFISAAVETILGLPVSFYIGKTVHEVIPVKAIADNLDGAIRRVIATGKQEHIESIFRRDGVLGYFKVSCVPEFGECGEVESVLSITRDVTELKRLTMQLREERNKLQALIDHAPVGIVAIDRAGKVLLSNPQAEEVLRSPLAGEVDFVRYNRYGICYPDGTPYAPQDLPLALAALGGENVFNRRVLIVRGGEQYWLMVNATPLRDASGGITGAISVLRDITDLKKAEEVLHRDRDMLCDMVNHRTEELIQAHAELERSRRLSDMGMLSSAIAHELRNPLAAIKAAAYNINRKAGDAPIAGHLATINKKIIESNDIIQNLLGYARIKTLRCENVNICDILDECFQSMAQKFPKWQVEARINYRHRSDGRVSGDPLLLQMLLTNVVDNAYQSFPGKEGRVTVDIARGGRGILKIVIADNGAGIVKADLERIFDPFFTRRSKGTGLGLTLCREIALQHGGSIAVESAPGEGTTVIITLPRTAKAPPASPGA